MVRLDYFARNYRKLGKWLDRVRNISPDQDPEMVMPLHVIVPIKIPCAVYTLILERKGQHPCPLLFIRLIRTFYNVLLEALS